MAFVLDASVSAVWALADESSPVADIAANRMKTRMLWCRRYGGTRFATYWSSTNGVSG